jgi:hypothetical protein
MAQTLSTSGIVTGQDVQPWHVTQSIDAFTRVSAFDITISGSFTLTGSLNVSGSILGITSESASIAITSSFTNQSSVANSSSFAGYNSGNLLTLQLYAPQIATLAASTTYYVGVGTSLITANNRTGIVVPINATIVKAVIISSIKGSTTAMTSVPSIMKNGTSIASLESLRYDAASNFILSNINQSITAGDRLSIRLVTTSGATPTNVTHKMILTLKPL